MTDVLPTIDLQQGQRVLGDLDSARALLDTFVAKLPSYRDRINDCVLNQSLHELMEEIHGLKGATCYTSTPCLHDVTSRFDTLLSKHHSSDPKHKSSVLTLHKELNDAIRRVLDAHASMA